MYAAEVARRRVPSLQSAGPGQQACAL